MPLVVEAKYDRSVPALLVTIGSHTWDYGALATLRSFGRVGVPAYAIVGGTSEPYAHSRYLTRGFEWRTSGGEAEPELVSGLLRICDQIGRPAVAIAGDDESAVLLARYRDRLRHALLIPEVEPELPQRLSDKAELIAMCQRIGMSIPRSVSPRTRQEIEQFCDRCSFPVVVKNPEPFGRLVAPAVPATVRAFDRDGLFRLLATWQPGTHVLIQEFIPSDVSEDWYVEALLGPRSEPVVAFSGRKLRAYPEGTGVGTCSVAVPNSRVIDLALGFCRDIGYVGVCDLDFRYDRRDDTYKLLDFNPRRGAQFRLFQSIDGIDVVRALHLQLTGQRTPESSQRFGVRHVVGLLNIKAVLAEPLLRCPAHKRSRGKTERAWFAIDDPKPAWVLMADVMRPQKLQGRARRAFARSAD